MRESEQEFDKSKQQHTVNLWCLRFSDIQVKCNPFITPSTVFGFLLRASVRKRSESFYPACLFKFLVAPSSAYFVSTPFLGYPRLLCVVRMWYEERLCQWGRNACTCTQLLKARMTRISRCCISQHQLVDCQPRLLHNYCLLVSHSAVDNSFRFESRLNPP